MIIHKDIGIDEMGVYTVFSDGSGVIIRPGASWFLSHHWATIPPEKIDLAIKIFGLSRDQVVMELNLLNKGPTIVYSKYTETRNVRGY